MDAAGAIVAVTRYIRDHNLDYPVENLAADRFEGGWSVYAPVDVDPSDPMAFLDMPVGRAVFLVGDSGRIERTSSSTPPMRARRAFAATARARARPAEPAPEATRRPPHDDTERRDAQIRSEASTLLDEPARQLADLAPPNWLRYRAEFLSTAEAGELWFATDQGWQPPQAIPAEVLGKVRRHRDACARMSTGPWLRLTLDVTHDGQLGVSYGYA